MIIYCRLLKILNLSKLLVFVCHVKFMDVSICVRFIWTNFFAFTIMIIPYFQWRFSSKNKGN